MSIRRDGLPFLLVFLIAALVFLQSLGFDFIEYDDNRIVYEHPQIVQGLTWGNIGWAFTHSHFYLYMPVTSISHMLDVSLFGLRPGGHHLTNVLLHATNAGLLYLALVVLSGQRGPSLFVAAVFAVHPLRVDPVLWIASRKDLTSGLFFLLTLIAYAHFARKPNVRRYALVAGCFLLGLISKPTVSVIPGILLLLDWWPLDRLNSWRRLGRLFLEKAPLFAMAAGAAVLNYPLEQAERSAASVGNVTLGTRLSDAAVNYVGYLFRLFVPVPTAIHYPPVEYGAWQPIAAAGLLVGITLAAVVLWRERYLACGWFWYLGSLLPASGLVRHGHTLFALRWVYLPHIGIYIMIAWSALALLRRTASAHIASAARPVAAGMVVLLALLAWREGGYWRNTETVFARAVEVTRRNDVAHKKLGQLYLRNGRGETALEHFRAAIAASPRNTDGYYQYGRALLQLKRYAEAAEQLKLVVANQPDHAWAFADLAIALSHAGRLQESLGAFTHAIQMGADAADVRYEYGLALLNTGQGLAAVEQFARAVAHAPQDAAFCATIATVLYEAGLTDDAVVYYQKALSLEPAPKPDILLGYGKALLDAGKKEEAAGVFRRLLAVAPANSEAAAYLVQAR